MTPKEKAKELYFKMHSQKQIVSKEAKQCALIAVDEIIKAVNDPDDTFLSKDGVDYWEEVKQEIKAL
jgi:hypothetical protein